VDHLVAAGNVGSKSTLNDTAGRGKRATSKKTKKGNDDDDFEDVTPEEDEAQGGIDKKKKTAHSLPKRIKIQLLHNRAVELAKQCHAAEGDTRTALLRELWQVQQFCGEVDENAEWPAEITELVGEELSVYEKAVCEHEFVTDELGSGWEHVENMIGQIVWARIGTGANSLDSYWWAAVVVGRSTSEKDAKPNQRKVSFYGENSASYLLASSKYIVPFTKEPIDQACKQRLPRNQQEEWELGYEIACLEFDGPQVGSEVLIRFDDKETGGDNWYNGTVTAITEKEGGGKTLSVKYGDGDEEQVQYPTPDVHLQLPETRTKAKRPREEKEAPVPRRPALEVMYGGIEHGGEAKLRDFMSRNGLEAQAGVLVEHGLSELETLLELFGQGYDPRSENKVGPFLEKLCDTGLNDADGRKVVEALRIENQTRLRKAMAGLTAGA